MAYIIGCAATAAVGYYLGSMVERSDMLDLLARFASDNDSIRSFLYAHETEMDSRI